jgi:hypothetical protein
MDRTSVNTNVALGFIGFGEAGFHLANGLRESGAGPIFAYDMAAGPYGAADRVFASPGETFPGIKWSDLASYMVSRVVVHGERRAREMEEVGKTLKAAGVQPVMAEATARLAGLGSAPGSSFAFRPAGPSAYRQVLDVLKRIAES